MARCQQPRHTRRRLASLANVGGEREVIVLGRPQAPGALRVLALEHVASAPSRSTCLMNGLPRIQATVQLRGCSV
ncbi:hypothetical protein MRX96_001157 [Rhipicephalus microplus]